MRVNDPETRFRRIHDRCNRPNVKCEIAQANETDKLLDEKDINFSNGTSDPLAPSDIKKESMAGFGKSTADFDPSSEEGYLAQDELQQRQQQQSDGSALKKGAKPPCGNTMPKFRREGLVIHITYPDDMESYPGNGQRHQELSAETVFRIFKNVSNEDVQTLGFDPKFARPEWMLVSVLPVPPPHVRPTVMQGDMQSEDDLTFQLVNIVKANLILEDAIMRGDPRHVISEFEKLLQVRVVAFFDNERQDNPVETQKTGRPLKTIRQRLKGKEGRLRGNLMGKRVDFSARTVITADPNLSIDQVGVPRSVALTLTVPVVVTPFNIDELRQLVANGPFEWPGAMYIVRADQTRVNLAFVGSKNDINLEYGWIVERHLRDDDVVLFNRQPSLHKMSIMGHRAKVLDWSTFRLNLSVTTPYNADFDGDEMNLHVPQSITAKADADQLMMVPRNIVTPQSNRNVMGIVQDALLGVCRMTKRDIFIEKDVFMCAMMWIATWDGVMPAPAIIKPRPLWTGKQLFSMVAPRINYRGKSKHHSDDPKITDPFNYLDSEVLIHDGELLQGTVDKNIVGTSGGSVIHITWLQKGWEDTRDFMNQIQCVVNYWLASNSYSIGVSDTVADASTINNIQDTLNTAREKVNDIMSKAQLGELKMMPGKPMMESFEMNINEVLNDARSTVGKSAQKSLKERNAIKGTVMSGSKGSALNISQIIACVGQQNVQGKRIKYGFKQRTLPHFAKDDLGMESRGFVENSYLRGLSAQEFFFHAMSGREGIIDTAIKTAETGYIQRRLVKAMETVMARYDTTLRNARGCVMQFLYGEDGMDAQKIEKAFFDTFDYSSSRFREHYYLDVSSDKFGKLNYINSKSGQHALFIESDLLDECRKDSELRILLDEEFEQLLRDRVQLRRIMACRGSNQVNDAATYLPVNIDRLIWNAQRQFRINTMEPTDIHPRVVIEGIKDLLLELVVVRGDDPISREAQYNATMLFQIFVRMKLATKRVLRDYRLTQEAFEWVLGSIRSDFRSSVVHPGDMCGVMAAQSIGEPATQMTLNTFHNTGISAKNVTLGVPRLNEILNVGKNIKTPSNVINLVTKDDQAIANYVISKIEFVKLGDITVRTEIHYDPDPRDTVIEEDQELVAFAAEFLNIDLNDTSAEDMSPWVLRIVLDDKFINTRVEQDSNFSLADIANKITENFGNGVHVIYSDNNSTNGYVLRIRILMNEENRMGGAEGGEGMNDGGDDDMNGNEDHELLRRMQKNLLEDLHLFGVPGIKKVYLSQKKVWKWDDATGFSQSKEWMLETDGSNLAEVMVFPEVDHTNTISNDIVEVLQVLGIEGARSSLFNELRGVLSFDGAYVNYRHIACLADCMTFGGYLMAVSRHGINKGESGPMLRASFEETVEVFMNAAVYSRFDMLDGVTENVMLGQLGKLGTGLIDLLLDHEKLSGAVDTVSNGMSNVEGGAVEGENYDGADATPFIQATPFSSTTPSWGAEGIMGNTSPIMGSFTPAVTTPYSGSSPSAGYMSPYYSAASSATPGYYNQAAIASMSPGYASFSPHRSAAAGIANSTPGYSPTRFVHSFNPASHLIDAVVNFVFVLCVARSLDSPAYSPTSPAYSPTSPAYSPTR